MTPETPKEVAGSCFCGAVRFVVQMPTTFCGHCHCSMCRRMHGAGYVTWLAVPPSQFRLESDPADVVRFPSSEHGLRSFCRKCGSSLFCENSQHPEQFDVALAAMSEPIDRAPQMHFFFSNRAPWVTVDDDLPKFGGATGMEPL